MKSWQKQREKVEQEYADYLQHPDYGDGLPHCDDLVLHAPGKCVYCDRHLERQLLRVKLGIAFTDQGLVKGWRLCPAQACRPVGTINRWGGNRALTVEEEALRSAEWQAFVDELQRKYPGVL